jgi:DNA (cytosine-5)-methyltransferase 1
MMNKDFIEFFAGIGLVRVGLEKEGWTCVFANDINSKKARIYENNFGLQQMIEGDIANLRAEKIPSAILATASFPCQDLSEAGLSKGINGSRSSSFWHFTSLLSMMSRTRRPSLILIENVRGFLTLKKGSNLVLAIKALNNLGYACDTLLIDGRYFVPQSRPRIFIICVLESQLLMGRDKIEHVSFKEHVLRPKQILRLMKDNSDLQWVNFDLPSISKKSATLENILDPHGKIPKEYWFSDELLNKHLQMMPSFHKAEIDGLKLKKENGIFTMYRRMRKGEQKAELRLDNIAGCLRSASGGSSKQFLVMVEKGEVRMRKFTIPELRRLMAVPCSFNLPDGYNDVYNALGEAVVPPVIEWIAKNILTPLCDFVQINEC